MERHVDYSEDEAYVDEKRRQQAKIDEVAIEKGVPERSVQVL